MTNEDNLILSTRELNPNLDKIHEHYQRVLARYFNEDGSPKKEQFEDVACLIFR